MTQESIAFSIIYFWFYLLLIKTLFAEGFNFWSWIKYGKIYYNWYKNREDFKGYLEKQDWFKEMQESK